MDSFLNEHSARTASAAGIARRSRGVNRIGIILLNNGSDRVFANAETATDSKGRRREIRQFAARGNWQMRCGRRRYTLWHNDDCVRDRTDDR